MRVIQIGNITDSRISRWKNPSVGRVYSKKGIAPCLNSMSGGGRTPLIVVRTEDEKDKSEECDKARIR